MQTLKARLLAWLDKGRTFGARDPKTFIHSENTSDSEMEVFRSFWHGPRLSPSAIACINSFEQYGKLFELYVYDRVANIPSFVTVKNANEILPSRHIFVAHDGIAHFSDVFRYYLLYEHGGWWIDTDVLCNSSYIPKTEFVFSEWDSGQFIANAHIKFPRNHPAIGDLIERLKQTDIPAEWGSTLYPLTAVIKEHDLISHAWPTSDLCPIHWAELAKFFLPEFYGEVSKRVTNSKFIHLYSSTFPRIGFDEYKHLPPQGSFLREVYDLRLGKKHKEGLIEVDMNGFRTSIKKFIEEDDIRGVLSRERLMFEPA